MIELMPLLKTGDEIRIISTARKISPTDLKDPIAFLESKGFKVTLGENLYKSDNQFAGTDKQRLKDLQNAIDDTNVKAIWIARGGFGTHRIIEGISFKSMLTSPKWLIGYSDVTVLHGALNKRNIPSLHATMPINFKDQSIESFEKLTAILSGSDLSYSIDKHPLNINGKANGVLLGGNLSILYSLLGSPFLPDFKNAILFIEDLDEYLYHVDRMLMNLKLAGVLDQISGLVVGGMSDMNDNAIPFGKNALEIISEHTLKLGVPVCYGFPSGHQEKNYPLIFGKKVYLNVDDEGSSLNY